MTLALILGPTACATLLAVRGRSLGASGSIILSQTIHTWAALIAILTSIESHLYSITSQITLKHWIELEGNTIPHQLLQDKLSSNMNWIIEVILLWVLIYSISYLRTDPTLTRYLITMNLFASSMHTLTNASGPIMMFIGWEWVGLSSYLLISYYTSRHASSHAAMKAILMNRIGDYSILIAAMISITWAHCTQWSSMTSILPILNSTPTTIYIAGQPIAASQLLAELILIAAVGKSAQLSQTSWLMDAMEGPTEEHRKATQDQHQTDSQSWDNADKRHQAVNQSLRNNKDHISEPSPALQKHETKPTYSTHHTPNTTLNTNRWWTHTMNRTNRTTQINRSSSQDTKPDNQPKHKDREHHRKQGLNSAKYQRADRKPNTSQLRINCQALEISLEAKKPVEQATQRQRSSIT